MQNNFPPAGRWLLFFGAKIAPVSIRPLDNNFIAKLFMNAKYNEEVICGWANESEVNEDAIRLTNILKRKSTVQALPQLNYIHSNMQTDHKKQLTTLKAINKDTILRKSHNILKIKREKTEGYDQHEEPLPSFKNEKISKAVELEGQKAKPSPYLTDCRLDQKVYQESNITELGLRTSIHPDNPKQRKSQTTTFSNIRPSKMTPIKSHEFIPQVLDRYDSPLRADSKYYVKLNTLEMVNDLRKQFRNDLLHKFGIKPSISQQKQIKEGRNTTKIVKNGVDIHEKINQRFRETFIKQDIFTKKKSRQKGDSKHEGNSPIMLSQHSIFIDRQSLQAKIQTLRSPQKGRLIFK